MLMRTDPFREFDRLAQQVFGTGTAADRPAAMPMDAYRSGDDFLVHFDLPGIDPETIELDVERNVLNVRAERRTPAPEGAELIVAERPTGTFTRQLFLGDTLDVDRIDASYEAGVLTLRIPVAEQAKPRRIQISGGDGGRKQIGG
jgi:HSP20 family protein